jgi:hypothetical protein
MAGSDSDTSPNCREAGTRLDTVKTACSLRGISRSEIILHDLLIPVLAFWQAASHEKVIEAE